MFALSARLTVPITGKFTGGKSPIVIQPVGLFSRASGMPGQAVNQARLRARSANIAVRSSRSGASSSSSAHQPSRHSRARSSGVIVSRKPIEVGAVVPATRPQPGFGDSAIPFRLGVVQYPLELEAHAVVSTSGSGSRDALHRMALDCPIAARIRRA